MKDYTIDLTPFPDAHAELKRNGQYYYMSIWKSGDPLPADLMEPFRGHRKDPANFTILTKHSIGKVYAGFVTSNRNKRNDCIFGVKAEHIELTVKPNAVRDHKLTNLLNE